MGRPDFGRLVAHPVPHDLHDHGNVVDGDTVEGIQHGLPTEPKVQVELAEHESANPSGFR